LVGFDGQAQRRESLDHGADGELTFQPGQCRAEAEVDAVAEAEVRGSARG
jgi:hypothetical protein